MENCVYAGKCGGCPNISVPYSEQIEKKRYAFNELIQSTLREYSIVNQKIEGRFCETRAFRTRDRSDLTYFGENNTFKFGFFSIDKSELMDIQSCPQMSPELEFWFHDFRKYLIPNLSPKASFRIRVGMNSLRGVWMDLPNLTIKQLLDEKKWLLGLLNQGIVVEMGQKRKRLYEKAGTLKLISYQDGAKLEAWTSTWIGDLEVPLYGPVGGFSQPGKNVNQALVREVTKMVNYSGGSKWLEIGSGNGNFSFSISRSDREVVATDFDNLALLSAHMSRENLFAVHESDLGRLSFEHLNFQSQKTAIQSKKFDSVLVDPPRSGLGSFVSTIVDLGAKNIVYVSCYPESWSKDVSLFLAAGYRLRSACAVDLFPGTEHFEVVSLLVK